MVTYSCLSVRYCRPPHGGSGRVSSLPPVPSSFMETLNCVASLFVNWRPFARIDRKQHTRLVIARYLASWYDSSQANHSPPFCHVEISARHRHPIATASAPLTSLDVWRQSRACLSSLFLPPPFPLFKMPIVYFNVYHV